MNAKLAQKLELASSGERQSVDWLLSLPSDERKLIKAVLSQLKQNTQTGKQWHNALSLLLTLSVPSAVEPEAKNLESGFDFLLSSLSKPETLAHIVSATDPLLPARLRGLAVKKELLTTGGTPWTSSQVAEYLGISRQAVDKRRREGKLLGLSLGKRGYRYPVWQFTDGETLAGLEQVLTQLSEYDSWTQLMFLLTGDVRLEGKTPLQCLQQGNLEAVVSSASSYGQQYAA
jgi:hypothetical protein